MYMYTVRRGYVHVRAGKKVQMFEPSFVCCRFNLNFSLRSFAATPTLMFARTCALVQSKCVQWSIMWACSSKFEAVLLAASVSFLSPAMLNPSRNSDKNKTSTCYKAIIQFWSHSIANQGKSNIDKNTCEPSNICSFLLTKLRMLFYNLRPSPSTCTNPLLTVYMYMYIPSSRRLHIHSMYMYIPYMYMYMYNKCEEGMYMYTVRRGYVHVEWVCTCTYYVHVHTICTCYVHVICKKRVSLLKDYMYIIRSGYT